MATFSQGLSAAVRHTEGTFANGGPTTTVYTCPADSVAFLSFADSGHPSLTTRMIKRQRVAGAPSTTIVGKSLSAAIANETHPDSAAQVIARAMPFALESAALADVYDTDFRIFLPGDYLEITTSSPGFAITYIVTFFEFF